VGQGAAGRATEGDAEAAAAAAAVMGVEVAMAVPEG